MHLHRKVGRHYSYEKLEYGMPEVMYILTIGHFFHTAVATSNVQGILVHGTLDIFSWLLAI